MELQYFNIRGRGEPIRLVLADAAVSDWKNTAVPRDEWSSMKQAGLKDGTIPFGQMPVLRTPEGHSYVQMNGRWKINIKIFNWSETEAAVVCLCAAIMRHLARRLGKYYGSNEHEQTLTDVYMDAAEDLRNKYAGLNYRGGFVRQIFSLSSVVNKTTST